MSPEPEVPATVNRPEDSPRPEEASDGELGQQLALSQEHLNGLHLEPRAGCWRCVSESMRETGERR